LINAFHFFLATMGEGASQVDTPRALHQLNLVRAKPISNLLDWRGMRHEQHLAVKPHSGSC